MYAIRSYYAAMVCLATGENVQVRVTAQGDTLVGPSRASIRTLRPGVVFAGTYAEGRSWYINDQDVTFENRAAFAGRFSPGIPGCRWTGPCR